MSKYIIFSLFIFIVFLFFKECDGLGDGYYIYDDGSPIVSIVYNNMTIVDCEVVDYVYNNHYILVYRIINEYFSRSKDNDNQYINKYKTNKQFFIIEKKTHYYYGPLTYEQYSQRRIGLSIPSRLELDTTKTKLWN
ncbi:MAG: DUF3997 domain-containing protein [Chitinophagales bacterium]|nr:DUF3997 domain-containing protein [Chitinophagales bacterium]